jgi:hypothetical protein
MSDILQNPPPPNLPLAPQEYERRYLDQHSNVLRLYFSRLQNALAALFGPLGGKYLNTPAAAIQRTTNVTFASNTATQVTFNQNDYLNGCLNDGTDGIIVQQSAWYNFQYSIQFVNTDAQAHNAWVWLRVNGADLAATGSKFDVPSKHGSSDGYLIAACNFYVRLERGDSVSLYVAVAQAYNAGTSTPGVYLEAYGAQTSPFPMPAIPSAVVTLTFVSSLPT